NRAQVGPHRVAAAAGAIVFASLDQESAVGQDRRAKIKWSIPAGQGGYLTPGAIDVAPSAVRGKLVPGAVIGARTGEAVWFGMNQNGPVRQQKHGAGIEAGLVGERLPGLAGRHSCPDNKSRQGQCQPW